MPTPPKRLTFAEEMELLKKQKAQAASLAREAAAQRLQQQRDQPAVNVDALIAAIPAAKAPTLKLAKPLGATLGSPDLAATNEGPATPEEAERLRKEQAMAAAFAFHVGQQGQGVGKKTGKAGGRQAMLFCTECRCTTPGEDVEPGSAGIGMALGLLGLVPGVAYFLYRAMASEKQCTHCHGTELVAMNSVQARTLCGEQHAALMENGWAEMRQAERDHTMQRRIAIGKILVVATVVLGASLYILRVPSGGIRGAVAHENLQKQQALRMELHEREVSEGQD